MKRMYRMAAVAVAVLALASCFERKQTAMINPDGSGKMVVDTYIAAGTPAANVAQRDAVEIAKELATGLVTKSQGVEAWKNLKVEAAADGRAHVVATAYFPDISKFRLEGALSMTWTKDEKGNFRLTIAQGNAASQPATAALRSPTPKLPRKFSSPRLNTRRTRRRHD